MEVIKITMKNKKIRKEKEVSVNFNFIKQMSDEGKKIKDLKKIEKTLGGRQ